MTEHEAFVAATTIIREANIGKLPKEKYVLFRGTLADALRAAYLAGHANGASIGFAEGNAFGRRLGYQNGYVEGARETRELYEKGETELAGRQDASTAGAAKE
jgi:hypothetical protein